MSGSGASGDTPDLNDNDWVDDILARALERARTTPPAQPAPSPSVAASEPPPATGSAVATSAPADASPAQPAPVAPQAPVAPTPRPEPVATAPVASPAPATEPLASHAEAAEPVAAAPLRTDAPSPHQPLFPRDVPLAADAGARPDPRPQRQPRIDPTPASVAVADHPGPESGSPDANDIPELDEYITEPVANRRMRSAIEWTAVIIGALVVAVLIKSFMFQAFFIPTPSMVPTLEVGDRILVNKLSYNLHDLNRGDVVVFHKPENASGDVEDLVKRVIALPGETLEIRDQNIYIDGRLLEEPYLKEPQSSIWTSQIPPGCLPPASTTQCVIPEGTAFVMGDNRTNSTDSRVFGPIDQDLIVGRAFLRVYPFTNIGRL